MALRHRGRSFPPQPWGVHETGATPNNDKTIGNLIAEAMEKVGKDAVITVEKSKSADTVLDLVEGMQFDRGYLSPYFVPDAERMEVAHPASGPRAGPSRAGVGQVR
jgi:hypothetical protein